MLTLCVGHRSVGAADAWCADRPVRPRVVAKVQDSDLMKTLGQAGLGAFVGPAAISDAICASFAVRVLGLVTKLKERSYAISFDRRLANPAPQAIAIGGRELRHVIPTGQGGAGSRPPSAESSRCASVDGQPASRRVGWPGLLRHHSTLDC
ncbi:MAG: hypothetical protein H0W72_10590 [Planctomycetes bacterium]|nr:hypothetical protein [Planctomycetota bacterium]